MSTNEGDLKVLLGGLAFPEGPRWHQGRLWFSDMHAHEVVAVDPATGERSTMATVPTKPSGLGWLPDGRMLVVSMTDRRVLRQEADGTLVVHADLWDLATFHCNDMVVDTEGRAYVGHFGYDLYQGAAAVRAPASLIRVDPDGTATTAADALEFPNGTVITPDGATLIVGESGAARLTAFTRGADGSLTDRRLWAALPKGTTPDGICLDADGHIWSACPRSGQVLRIAEGGEVLSSIQLPTGLMAYACMLGGADGRTLFVCAAATSDPVQTVSARSGCIMSVDVDVPGAGLP